MDAKPHAQRCGLQSSHARSELGIERRHGVGHLQPGSYSPLRIIFMGLGIPKVDQESVPEVLGDVSIKALHDLSTGRLIRPNDLPQIFRIQLTGQGS